MCARPLGVVHSRKLPLCLRSHCSIWRVYHLHTLLVYHKLCWQMSLSSPWPASARICPCFHSSHWPNFVFLPTKETSLQFIEKFIVDRKQSFAGLQLQSSLKTQMCCHRCFEFGRYGAKLESSHTKAASHSYMWDWMFPVGDVSFDSQRFSTAELSIAVWLWTNRRCLFIPNNLESWFNEAFLSKIPACMASYLPHIRPYLLRKSLSGCGAGVA